MRLNSQESKPLYQQLMDKILDGIERGLYLKGSKIPTEAELSKLYNVSRITVRKALKELADMKILERKQGKGTFVSSLKLQRSIASFIGFSEMCAAQGLKANSKVLKSVIECANEEDRQELGLTEEAKVIVLERILYADGVPVTININRFTEDYVFLLDEDLNDLSLLSLMKSKYGITFQNDYKVLELSFSNYEMSRYLGIPQKYPLLQISAVVNDHNGISAYRDLQYIVGDKFKFYI